MIKADIEQLRRGPARPPAVDEHGNRLPHNRPWETEVESYFHILRPPGRSEDMIRLGIDDNQDLASIVEVQRLKPVSEYPIPEYFIRAMAVALTHRGRGGAVADAAMEDMLTELARRVAKSGVAQFIISGNIHELNKASQTMAVKYGVSIELGVLDGTPNLPAGPPPLGHRWKSAARLTNA